MRQDPVPIEHSEHDLVSVRLGPLRGVGPAGGVFSKVFAADLAARLPPPFELFARHAGNVRTALRELFDYCAGRSALSTT